MTDKDARLPIVMAIATIGRLARTIDQSLAVGSIENAARAVKENDLRRKIAEALPEGSSLSVAGREAS